MSPSRILVVDDVRHIAHFLKRVLEKAGFEAHALYSGERLEEAIRQLQPAAVLLDVNLPGRSGLEICRALRQDPATRDLRILIVTAHSFDAGVHEIHEAGADWHFTKPISPTALLAKLQELGVEPGENGRRKAS